MTTYTARLDQLERHIARRDRCPACGNHPTRFVGITDAGKLISETMPESGCPACGRTPRQTVTRTGVDVANVIRPAGKAG